VPGHPVSGRLPFNFKVIHRTGTQRRWLCAACSHVGVGGMLPGLSRAVRVCCDGAWLGSAAEDGVRVWYRERCKNEV